MFNNRFFTVLCAFLLVSGLCLAGDNLLVNGDFEANLDGWDPTPPTVAGQLDNRIFRGSLGRSLKLAVAPAAEEPRTALQSKRFARNPEVGRYKFSAWFRTENVLPPVALQLNLFCWDKNGKWLRQTLMPVPAWSGGDTDWRRAEAVCEPAADVAFFSVAVGLRAGKEKILAAATAWIDDIAVTEFPLTAAEAAARKAEEEAGIWMHPIHFQEGAYHVIEEFPHGFEVSLYGDVKAMQDAVLVLDLPDGFAFIGAAPRYNEKLDPAAVTAVIRDDRKYTRCTITPDHQMIRSQIKPGKLESGIGISWGNYERIWIRAARGTAGANAKAFLKAAWNGGNDATREYVIDLKVLPAVKPPDRKAERFELYRSVFFQLNVGELESVAAAQITFWNALQKKPWTAIPYHMFSQLPESVRRRYTDNFRMAYMFYVFQFTQGYDFGEGYQKRLTPVLKADGTAANANKENICPTALLDGPDAALLEEMYTNLIIGGTKTVTNVEAVVWDYEPKVEYDYCDNCRRVFAAYAKLPATPGIKEVREKHAEEWFFFRTQQHATLLERIAGIARKRFPKQQFWICTDPLHADGETLARWCGVDARLADPVVDVHLCMPYYSGLRFFNDVELNLRTLKKPVFPLNDAGGERQFSFFSAYTPARLKQNIVAAAMLGCQGFGLWPDEIADGLYMTKTRDAYQIVGAGEDYYFGRRDDAAAAVTPANVAVLSVPDEKGNAVRLISPPFDRTVKWAVHRKDKGFLVTMLNYDTRTAVMSVRVPALPDDAYRVIDAETRRVYVDGKGKPLSAAEIRRGFLAIIEPDDAVALEITAATPPAGAGTLSQSVPEELLKSAPAHVTVDRKEGNAAISQVVLISGALGLALEADGNRLVIDQGRRAAAVSWKVAKADGFDLLAHRKPGVLDEFVFFKEPRQLRYEFKLQRTEIRDGEPRALFVCKPELVGADPNPYAVQNVTVEKEVLLERGGTLLRSRYRFTHNRTTGAAAAFGFRIKHLPVLAGARLTGDQRLTDVVRLRLLPPAGASDLVPADANTILSPGSRLIDFCDGSDTFGRRDWTVSPVAVQAAAGGMLKITPDPRQTAGAFVWWSPDLFTFEPLSVELTLRPGETAEYESVVEYIP